MQLKDIIKNISYNGYADKREIISIAYDSRKVKVGTLFVAIAGFNVDGHDYISQAVNNGASAILSNGRSPKGLNIPVIQVKNPRMALSEISAQFYGNPSQKMNIIGITGTNGKTSITHILSHIMNNAKIACGTMGTLGFKTPSGMTSTGFTTPESVEVQQMLQTLNIAGINNVVMEISSHALNLHRVNNVDINIAIFSNLTREHLDFHGNMENYFQSKPKLFKQLNRSNTAIININDPYSERISNETLAEVAKYGFDKKADLYPLEYTKTIDGLKAIINYGDKKINVRSNLIGDYNLLNIMAAITASLKLNIPIEIIEKSITTIPQIPGRLEQINCKCLGRIYIDYAHTPDAFKQLFSTINGLINSQNKIITIFGCGGNRDKEKRAEMAKISELYSSYTYITSDNPRTEPIEKINHDIIQGFSKSNFKIIYDRKQAIESAMQNADNNTIILILGKGREKYQEINNIKHPHSDVEIIENYNNAI